MSNRNRRNTTQLTSVSNNGDEALDRSHAPTTSSNQNAITTEELPVECSNTDDTIFVGGINSNSANGPRIMSNTNNNDVGILGNRQDDLRMGFEGIRHVLESKQVPHWATFTKEAWSTFLKKYKTYKSQFGTLMLWECCEPDVKVGIKYSMGLHWNEFITMSEAEAISLFGKYFSVDSGINTYKRLSGIKMQSKMSEDSLIHYIRVFEQTVEEEEIVVTIDDKVKIETYVNGLIDSYEYRDIMLFHVKTHPQESFEDVVIQSVKEMKVFEQSLKRLGGKLPTEVKQAANTTFKADKKHTSGGSTDKSDKIDKVDKTNNKSTSSNDKKDEKKKLVCFNCEGSHRIRDCPKDKDRDMIEANKKKYGWKPPDKSAESDNKATANNVGNVKMVTNTGSINSKCMSNYIDIYPVNLNISAIGLIDTGADVPLVSEQMFKKLLEAGMVKHDGKKEIQLADEGKVTLTEYIDISLEYRGEKPCEFKLRAWVTSCAADFIIDVVTATNNGLVILPATPSSKFEHIHDYVSRVCMYRTVNGDVMEDQCTSSDNMMGLMPLDNAEGALAFEEMVKSRVSNSDIKTDICDIIYRYRVVFDEDLSQPAKVADFKIALQPGASVPHHPPRRLAPPVEQMAREEIEKLLSMGIIQKSESSVVSPIVMVTDGKGKKRLCIDYRDVNSVTVPNRYPNRNVIAVLERVMRSKYFVTMDLRKGYHQIPMDPASKYLTAFTVPWGVFEYLRMPFGVRNGPAKFQATMDTIFSGMLYHGVEVFVDDILIHSESAAGCLDLLEKVLKKLKEYHLKVSLTKSLFGYNNIEYIGYHIDAEGFAVTEKHRNAIQQLAIPTTKAQVRSMNGLFNYFKIFIPRFAWLCKPLYMAAAGKGELVWTEECNETLNKLKHMMQQVSKLYYINYDEDLYLSTDASNMGVGGVLYQKREGKVYPSVFVSVAFNDTQKKWATIEQEAFAVYFCIIQCSKYIGTKKFILETDHRNLLWLDKAEAPKLVRWRLRLAEFNYETRFIEGKSNIIADSLSRLPIIAMVSTLDAGMGGMEELLKHQDYYKIVKMVHNNTIGHRGVFQTLKLLTDMGITWPEMKNDVSNVVKACVSCQKLGKHYNIYPNTPYHIDASEPFQKICVDTIGPLPADNSKHRYIIVFVDVFTRYVELYPCATVEAKEAADCLLKVFGRYGLPETLISDNGTQYVNEIFQSLLSVLNICHVKCVPYRHEGNGIVERLNWEIMEQLRHLVMDAKVKKQWGKYIPCIQYIINSQYHSGIGVSPMELVYGKGVSKHRGILQMFKSHEELKGSEYVKELDEVLEHIADISRNFQEKVKEKAAATVIDMKYHNGDYILRKIKVKRGKFDINYLGPYKVESVMRRTIKIKHLNREVYEICDINDVKPYNRLDDEEVVSPDAVAARDHDMYVVEEITSHTGDLKDIKHCTFLVKWEGYDGLTWEPYKNLKNVIALQKYMEKE